MKQCHPARKTSQSEPKTAFFDYVPQDPPMSTPTTSAGILPTENSLTPGRLPCRFPALFCRTTTCLCFGKNFVGIVLPPSFSGQINGRFPAIGG